MILCQAAAAPPAGFIRSPVALGLTQPTALEFTEDGRLFVAERLGRVLVIDGAAPIEALQLENVDFRVAEGGLLGMARHPAFAETGWMYLFYTHTPGAKPHSRVSRFRAVESRLDPSSEEVIWEIELDNEGHFAGCLVFGRDGHLYISTGDNWSAERSQDLARPEGKIFRVRDDGTIPDDNPFLETPGARPDIWAYGFRNPFRMSIDALTGDLYVGDVGAGAWEEIDRVRAGDNGGWPLMEGPQCYIGDCSDFLQPIWSYAHGGPGGPGASLILGPVYRGEAMPKEYRGNVFIADFIHAYVKRVVLDENGAVIETPLFDPDQTYVVDMDVGPDGALYVAHIFGKDMGVQRIEHIGTLNEPPVAVAAAEPDRGNAPLTVQFSSAGSFDPDAGPGELTYSWTFGDGASSSAPSPQHTYEQRGQYLAYLTVHDGLVGAVSQPITIVVGAAPSVTLVTLPPADVPFRAGDTIVLAALAYDVEDGELPDDAFTWSVYIVRPPDRINILAGPVIGERSGSFVVPTHGRTLEDSLLRIEVTATDSDGTTTTVTRELLPLVSPLTLDTVPSGIPVFLDDQPFETPYVHHGPADYLHDLRAQPSYSTGGVLYEFVEWRDGDGRRRPPNPDDPRVVSFAAPEGGATFVAVYRAHEPEPTPQLESGLDDADAPRAGPPCFLPLFGAAAAVWVAWRARAAAGG